MKKTLLLIFALLAIIYAQAGRAYEFPAFSEQSKAGYFPLSQAAIYTDGADYKVVGVTAAMLADAKPGRQRVKIYLLDPGIVLQELCVHSAE